MQNTSTTTNSLFFSAAGGLINDTGGSNATLTINSGGILVGPGVGPSLVGFNNGINGSRIGSTSGNAQKDIIINQNDPNGALLLTGVVDNGTAVSLVKNGPGVLLAWGNSTNTGTTCISQGVIAQWQPGGIGSPPAGTSWVTFTGNGALQFFEGPIPGGPVLNQIITINSGATGTIDQSYPGAGTMSGGSIVGGGSLVLTNSFGLQAATLQIRNSGGNTYTGTTTILNLDVSLNYQLGQQSHKLNPNNTAYLGGDISLVNSNSVAANQTLGSSLALIAGTTSDIAQSRLTANTPAGTTFNLSSATGGIIRPAGTALVVMALGTPTVFHLGNGTANVAGVSNVAANFTTNFLGGWATYGSVTSGDSATQVTYTVSDWAGLNGSNNIVSYTSLGGTYNANTWSGQTDITTSGSFSGTTNSVRFNTSGGQTATLASGSTIASGGILVTTGVGANTTTITGGTLTSGNSQDLIVNQFNTTAGSQLTIGSQITGSIGLTIAGNTESTAGAGGLVVLTNGSNSYTGPTAITAATTLRTDVAGAIPTNSAVMLSKVGTFNLNGNNQSVGSIASNSYGATINGGGATLTVGNDNTNTTFNGILSNLSLVKTGTGTLTLGFVDRLS